MSKLGERAQGLVSAGRLALRPMPADRARNLEALRQRIGAGESPAGGSALFPKPAAKISWKTVSLGATVIGIGGVLAAVAFSSSRAVTRQPLSVVPSASALSPTSATVTAAPLVQPDAEPMNPPSVTPSERPAIPQVRTPSRLSEEIAILSHAEAEMHAGRAAAALQILDEHQRKFPRGTLTQERIAARIQALCALGRNAEADTALAHLKHVSRNSLHESRAQEACASAAKR